MGHAWVHEPTLTTHSEVHTLISPTKILSLNLSLSVYETSRHQRTHSNACQPRLPSLVAQLPQTYCTVGNPETIYLFYRGLSRNILIDVLKPPHVYTYEEMKEQAIKSSKSHQLLDNILGPWPQFAKFQQRSPFPNAQQGQWHPFFIQNNQWRNQQTQMQQPQYNLSNTPC